MIMQDVLTEYTRLTYVLAYVLACVQDMLTE